MPDKIQKSKIIVDTSSWINVFRVDLTSYLIENFSVLVTPKVNEEILEGKGFAEDVKLFEKLSTELRKVLKDEVIDKAKEVLKDAGNKAKRGI
jgi:hypothetical protein